MNRYVKINVILFGVLLFATAGSANSYSELSQLVKEKKYDAAFQLADGMSEKESGNMEFDMLYGLAARESKNHDIAVFAFERILIRNPKNARAHYEMALTLFNISDFKGAQSSLKNALNSGPSANIRENALKLQTLTNEALKQQSRARAEGTSVVKIGYNSNVNGSSTEITLEPPRGPVQGDGYAEVMLSGKFQRRLSKNDGLFFVLTDVLRKNFSSTNFDYNVTIANLGYNVSIGNLRITIPYSFTINIAQYRPVLFSNAVGVISEIGISQTQSLAAEIMLVSQHRPDAINDQISTQIKAKHKGAFLNNRLSLGTEIYYNPAVVRGSGGIVGNSVRDEIGFAHQLSYSFTRAHTASLKAKYENLSYWLVPNDQSASRMDHSVSTNASYSFNVNSNLSLSGAYIFAYRFSNKPENANARHEAYLSASAKF